MKFKRRKWYLKGTYSDWESANKRGKILRKQTGCCYNITHKGIIGGWELWVTARGYNTN